MTGGRMQGKVAIVTGAGSGIGRGAAELLAREGARVAVVDRIESGAAATVAAITASGGDALAITADVTSEQDMARMAAETVARYGRIDALHANAGIGGAGKAHEETPAGWQRIIDVNLTGVWLTCRAVLPTMIEQRSGSLVLTSSVGGVAAVRGLAAYAAAKAGVIGLMRSMAIDYAADGIRVNAICPGTTWTPLVEETYRAGGGPTRDAEGNTVSIEKARELSEARYPLGRLGTIEEVAHYVLFLASDETGWTTGTVSVMDGGMTV